ncbi:MAG: hypothetical protein JNL82_39065 [Myxococcales bacterium]|nr:hypothetical protein [Myxococcales bacterium]
MHGPHLRLVPPGGDAPPPVPSDGLHDHGDPLRELDALLAGPLADAACARLAELAALVPGRQRAAAAHLGATASGAAVDALLALAARPDPDARPVPGVLEALTRCLARGVTRRFPPLALVDRARDLSVRPGQHHLSDLSARPGPDDSLDLSPRPGPAGPLDLSPRPGPVAPLDLAPRPGPVAPLDLSARPGPAGSLDLFEGPGPGAPRRAGARPPTTDGPRLPPRRPGAPPLAAEGPSAATDAPRVLALDFRSSRTRSFPDLVRRAQAVADVARACAVFETLAVVDRPGDRQHYRLAVWQGRAPAAAVAAALRAAHLDLTWLHARLVRLRGTRLWLNGWSFADDHPIGPAAQAHLLQAWLRWAEQEPAP